MPLRFSILVTTAVGIAACGTAAEETERSASTENRIVGGNEAAPGAFPSIAALHHGTSFICGGTLVADRWVLTAAHCLDRGPLSFVTLGRNRRSSRGGEEIAIKRAIVHPGYAAASTVNDIALLELTRAARAPIGQLATPAEAAAATAATAAGWGATFEGAAPSDELREVSVPVIPHDQCRKLPGYGNVDDGMLCAGDLGGGKDSCQGDSGGPLYATTGRGRVQIGVVSWGRGCAQPNAPGVYAHVARYLGWIHQHIGGAPPATAPNPPPPPPAPPPDRPRIRAAWMQLPEWLYLEWEPVAGATHYKTFAGVLNPDGSFGETVVRDEAGATDRGPFRYTYFHKDELCAAAARGPGAVQRPQLFVQVWPGDDATRAETAVVTGTLTCD